jgi:signal peptidase I
VAFELELIPANSGSNTKKYKEMNRRISVNTTGFAVPQSFITKGKQRLKQHIDTVYLNNGDEFEIELYNPTQNKVLAKIEMNGNSIGNGIILRPGERVFLERYLDEAKKFLFETYVVNGNNEEVQQAIGNNGDVVVKFYDEVKTSSYNVNSGTVTINNPNFGWGSTTTGSPYYGNATFTTSSTSTFYNASLTSGAVNTNSLRNLETGRVEKGSNSNQSFTYDNSSFYTFPFQTNWWKIKPQSTRPLVIEDLVVYCTECGAKRKKDNHKFCPHCGTKY